MMNAQPRTTAGVCSQDQRFDVTRQLSIWMPDHQLEAKRDVEVKGETGNISAGNLESEYKRTS